MDTAHLPARQTNHSSIRLLQILECLAHERIAMRLQDISAKTGMTQSTVLRYLYALQDANYVYQESDTLRYALTWRICGLSDSLASLLSLRNITTPFVNKLANTLSLGACLVVEKDGTGMYLDCIDNPRSTTLQRIGKQAPLYATGSGKVLLSQYSESQLTAFLESTCFEPYTEHTITNPEALRKELAHVREQDFAQDLEECEVGLRCFSVPLRDYTGRVFAAMSVFGNTEDMTDERIYREIYPMLKSYATTISTRLGYQASDPLE